MAKLPTITGSKELKDLFGLGHVTASTRLFGFLVLNLLNNFSGKWNINNLTTNFNLIS